MSNLFLSGLFIVSFLALFYLYHSTENEKKSWKFWVCIILNTILSVFIFRYGGRFLAFILLSLETSVLGILYLHAKKKKDYLMSFKFYFLKAWLWFSAWITVIYTIPLMSNIGILKYTGNSIFLQNTTTFILWLSISNMFFSSTFLFVLSLLEMTYFDKMFTLLARSKSESTSQLIPTKNLVIFLMINAFIILSWLFWLIVIPTIENLTRYR